MLLGPLVHLRVDPCLNQTILTGRPSTQPMWPRLPNGCRWWRCPYPRDMFLVRSTIAGSWNRPHALTGAKNNTTVHRPRESGGVAQWVAQWLPVMLEVSEVPWFLWFQSSRSRSHCDKWRVYSHGWFFGGSELQIFGCHDLPLTPGKLSASLGGWK